MTDPQLIATFCIGCGIVVLVGRMVSAAKLNAQEECARNSSLPNRIIARNLHDLEARSEELVATVTRTLRIRRDKLDPNADLRNDLRIPPGELESLLDDLQERFGIRIEAKQIRTVGDILSLIERKPGESGVAK